jgi:hypothetical protein
MVAGFIINNENDTVRGSIDFRRWDKNPDRITFLAEGETTEEILTPLNILEFHVKGEIFVSAIVDSEITNLLYGELPRHPEPDLKTDTIFLQTLVKGEKSLYYFKNAQGNDNFYIKGDESFELLTYKKYRIVRDLQARVAENKRFLGQLAYYLSDCPNIQSALRRVEYNKRSLGKLFQFYYSDCVDSAPVFEAEKKGLKIDLGIFAGPTISRLDFRSSNSYWDHLTEVNYGSSFNFSGGFFFDIFLPFSLNNWSINTEAIYTTYKFSGEYNIVYSEFHYSESCIDIATSYAKINNLIRYRFFHKENQFYLNAGISNGFIIRATNSKKTYTKFYDNERFYFGGASSFDSHEQGLVFGAGLKRKKLGVEARIERGNGFSRASSLGTISSRYYLLIGYTF